MTLSSDRPSGPVAAPQQVQCLCGHDAGSHNALKFNCMATTGGTHATRCGCKAFTDADRPSGQTPTEAGRDMDALIATRVFGWEIAPPAAAVMRFVSMGNTLNPSNVPHYSTRIVEAWTVVEKMRERGVYIDVETTSTDYRAVTSWEGGDDEDIWVYGMQHHATAAPLAICLAALSAIEDKQP